MTAPAPRPYLQVHPSRRCNLRCRHCYTASGPDERDALPVAALAAAVADAAGLGYGELSVSGGEPLMYDGLEDLLAAARDAGLATSVTTNAMALTPRRLARLRPLVDLLAISIDGTPASHDRMRAHDRAFATTASRLPGLRESGIPFAFITTLTLHNAHELPWLMDFAAEEGAAMLQVHPLDGRGRAVAGLLDQRPDAVELGAALLAAAAFAPPGLVVHVDAVMREQLAAHPERFAAGGTAGGARLGEWLPSLVVEPDGAVVPLTYGLDRRFALGSLTAPGGPSLRDLAEAWVAGGCADRLAQAVRRAWAGVVAGPAEIVFWFEELTRLVAAAAGPLPAAAPRRRIGLSPGPDPFVAV
jgi:MoaA/NifB/PqqE/SkfB family radical SAM enzyme